MKRRSVLGAIAGLFCLPWWKPKPTQEITVDDLLRVKQGLDENRGRWIIVTEFCD